MTQSRFAATLLRNMPLQIEPANPVNDGPDGTSADGDMVTDQSGSGNNGTGLDGANDSKLTWRSKISPSTQAIFIGF
ncbi:hypothetical protein KA005_15295 [bacterium]|nr:hypothetical protein [bacterium]